MRGVELMQQEEVERLRRLCGHTLSAHAFPSLYLWQEQLSLELELGEAYFAARMTRHGGSAWFFPCGSEAGRLSFLAAHGGEAGLRLLYLRREDMAWLQAREPDRWRFCRRPDGDEYLYLRGSHLAMAGGPFRDLRRRLRKIERELEPQVQPLDDGGTADARRIVEAWAAWRPGSALDDRQVALEALERRTELGMRGVIVYLRGQPASFMLGFPLSEDSFDAAVGKSAVDVQGLTYYTLHALMRTLPECCRWMNLEEDLGLPGLREMKENFLPDGRHEIWEAQRL